ncbi:MAG: PepSY-associated TM helix domain-containing protein [Nostoc sp.]|uniref:PepSY-associated TM helix domain-containing protein n=1 Tax=Nostoc sp. TaxID=1180 RepID=UPI002FFAF986
MNSKKLRNLMFALHRYIGLGVGLIAIIVGLTGSLLVFHTEISDVQLYRQIGTITPQGEPLPIETILNTVKSTYANQPDALLQVLYLPVKPSKPANIVYATKENDWIDNYVNPYTGVVLGNTLKLNAEQHFFKVAYKLHYALLAGDIGLKIVGIVGLLMCILSITGLVLWPGWRKLIAGFRIKWNAHPKRVNFDIHKLVGVVVAIFLVLTFFTGFCWNFYQFSESFIRAVTFSPPKTYPISKLIALQSPLPLTEQLKTAQAALLGAELQTIYFPQKPEDTLSMRYKFPQEAGDIGRTEIYLDRYSGKVLRVDNGLEQSLGDRIFNSFGLLHFGTFGGLLTRIFYVFVGLAPLILFVTGFVMWRYRHRTKSHIYTTSNSNLTN